MTYRADHVSQKDGSALQWQNCRMAVGSTQLDFHTRGRLTTTGAEMRTHQSDQSGGTDAYDLQRAWLAGFDQTLVIRNGKYWADLEADRAKGRFVALDVWYAELPDRCQENGNIGHTVGIAPETRDGLWLVSDPLCSGYKWMDPDDLRRAGEAWGSRNGIGKALGYTTSEVINVAISFDPKRIQVPQGTDIYDAPDGARITEFSKAVTVSSLGYVRGNADWFSVAIVTGGVRTIGYVKDANYTKEPTPGEVWDNAVWATIGDPNAVYPCGDDTQGGQDAQAIRDARDAEWIDHLTPA